MLQLNPQIFRLTLTSDFVFFAAYIQPPPVEGGGLWSDTDETERVNGKLLGSVL